MLNDLDLGRLVVFSIRKATNQKKRAKRSHARNAQHDDPFRIHTHRLRHAIWDESKTQIHHQFVGRLSLS